MGCAEKSTADLTLVAGRSRGVEVTGKKGRESMSVGMILLALWLILQGLPLIVRFVIPNKVMGILALLAGILILIGR